MFFHLLPYTLTWSVVLFRQPNDKITDQYDKDAFWLIETGKFYGHPNKKRAAVQNDPRQCVWHKSDEPANNGFTPPLLRMDSSTDGMIEFTSKHFKSQMRGNVITSQYGYALQRLILAPDGRSMHPAAPTSSLLMGNGGLVVTQAPNGNLVDGRYSTSLLYYYAPTEPASTSLEIKAIFPVRGALAGGSKLNIYGELFTGTLTVTVGGRSCTNVANPSAKRITCTLPLGVLGKADVVVSNGGQSDTFTQAYRYITGHE
jgi:IPT/TIG domain